MTKVYLANNQVLTSGIMTIVQFNTVVYDRNAEWSNYKFTAKSSGWFHVMACARLAISANNEGDIRIFYNNVNLVAISGKKDGAGSADVNVSTYIHLGLGDFVDVRALQLSGVNKNITGTIQSTRFEIHKVIDDT